MAKSEAQTRSDLIVHRTYEKGSVKTEVIPDTRTVQQEGSGKSSGKSSGKILELLAENPKMTTPQLAKELGISTRAIEKQIAKLQKNKELRRIGPAKGGHWQVVK